MPELPSDTWHCSRFDPSFVNCHYKHQGFFEVIFLSAHFSAIRNGDRYRQQGQCSSLINKSCLFDLEGWEGNGPKEVENGLRLAWLRLNQKKMVGLFQLLQPDNHQGSLRKVKNC